jgi:hypothetical protein
VHDSAWLAVTYWQTVCRSSGKSEGNILNVNLSDGFCIDGIIFSWQNASSQRLLIQNVLSNEEMLIVLRWQINFDTHRTEAAIGQTNSPRLTGRSRSTFWTLLIYMLVLPEGQTGETWEPAKKLCSIGNRGTLNKNSSKLIVGHFESVRTVRVSGCVQRADSDWPCERLISACKDVLSGSSLVREQNRLQSEMIH